MRMPSTGMQVKLQQALLRKVCKRKNCTQVKLRLAILSTVCKKAKKLITCMQVKLRLAIVGASFANATYANLLSHIAIFAKSSTAIC